MNHARQLSSYDRCARLPKLEAEYAPARLPIREATRRAFLAGIADLARCQPSARVDIIDACLTSFLAAAGTPGYLYPSQGEPYVIAQDHAAWLGGALAIACEDAPFAGIPAAAAPYLLAGQPCSIDLGAWRDLLDDSLHLYRVGESADLRTRWPEQLAAALEPAAAVWVHWFRMPRVNSLGRLGSPLALGYEHPFTRQIRLAKFESDRGSSRRTPGFSANWRRVGRWEQPEISWEEWRRGIDADLCMDACQRSWRSAAAADPQTLQDARRILRELEWSGLPPRRWEACTGCLYQAWCHGTEEERDGYIRIEGASEAGDQALRGVPGAETALSIRT